MAGGVSITKEVVDWLESIATNGAFVVASDGKGTFAPGVDKLVRAINTVLAGGDVDLVVKVPGDATQQKLLDDKLDAAMGSLSVSTGAISAFVP